MTVSTQPSVFSVRETKLLSKGQSMALLARTPRLWIHVKVYAEGGENALHAHAQEDHAFYVLQGEATFIDADGGERIVRVHEGLMLPRGVPYAFRSSGNVNLVMLRVGADASDAVVDAAMDKDDDHDQLTNSWPQAQSVRVTPDGAPFPATDKENRDGGMKGEPLPGAYFGA